MDGLHYHTYDMSGLILTLRDDLVIALPPSDTPRDVDNVDEPADAFQCVIEDPATGQFFRLGISEYTFVSCLDGRTTVGAALAETAAVRGSHALTENQAAGLCQWLIENQLATTPQSQSAGRLAHSAQQAATQKFWQSINPITLRISLLNPDAFLSGAARALGWVFAWPAVLLWCSTLITGVLCVAVHWRRFAFGAVEVVSGDNWLWLAGSWMLLRLVHELAHGVACRRYHGSVPSAGIVLVLFLPLPYVDVTSAWRFERWPRIVTSAAGMYAELFVAAIAAIVWSRTDTGVLNFHARNVMLTGSVISLLFNANPLMRFDGYYMLSDALRIPNLSIHGQRFVGWLGQRWLLGMNLPAPAPDGALAGWPAARARHVFVQLYGLAAFCWRVLICVTLVIAAAFLFHGAGIVLAGIAVLFWLAIPIVRLTRLFHQPGPRPRWSWMSMVCVAAGLSSWLLWAVVPWVGRVEAPAVVDYAPLKTVRSPVRGFVTAVFVSDGDEVDQDQPLLQLSNRPLELEAAELLVAIQQSEQRARGFRMNEEIAALQIELENRTALHTRHARIQKDLEQLIVRSPAAGTILGVELHSLIGRHISAGEHLLQVGSRRSVQALVSQRDLAVFRERAGQLVTVRIRSAEPIGFAARLLRIQPRASDSLPHPAFGSVVGGSLAVRRDSLTVDSDDNTVARGKDADVLTQDTLPGWKLVDPHFTVEVELPDEISHQLRAGQKAVVSFRTSRGTVGTCLRDFAYDWYDQLAVREPRRF